MRNENIKFNIFIDNAFTANDQTLNIDNLRFLYLNLDSQR